MYRIVSPSSEPSVIGVNNGVCQVELNEKKSFVNKEEKKYYESFFNGNFNSFILDSYKDIDPTRISELAYTPLKKAKETDFVHFSPNEMGLDFLVSQKVVNIIECFSICDYIKISSRIEGFKNQYYTIGFPIITEDVINYPKSRFYHLIKEEKYTNLSKEDYKKISGALVRTLSLKLINSDKLKRDIINLQGQGMFFSTSLISKLKEENVSSFDVGNTILEIN